MSTTITITSSTMAVTVTAANTPPTAATAADDDDPLLSQLHSGTVKITEWLTIHSKI